MKKLLAVVLCLFITIGCMTMSGCKEDSVFDGNYTEVDQASITAFATEVENKETVVDLDDGVKMTFDMNISVDGETISDIEMTLFTALFNNKIQMQGEMDMKVPMGADDDLETISSDIWYEDDYMYMKSSYDGQDVKYKMEMGIEDFISDYTNGVSEPENLDDLLEMYKEAEGIKYYLDQTETISKIKIEIPEVIVDGEKIKLTAAFVYDAEQTLYAVMMDMEMSVEYLGETMDTRIYITIEQWSGEIELPSDFDEYILMED